jgi:predicted dienelactone hydrolase
MSQPGLPIEFRVPNLSKSTVRRFKMNRKWIITALCIVAIVVAAISIHLTVQAVASSPADQTGPYKVGFVMNTYYDSTRSDNVEGARPIQTYVWYPAAPDNDGNPLPPAVYPLISLVGSISYPDASSTDFEAYGLDPAYQEVAASKDGPFPLVVLSPGAGATSPIYIQIGARLASHGFVVAIPTNYTDRFKVTGEPEFYPNLNTLMVGAYIERTRDVQYLMTRLVADSQQSGNLLSGTIRPDQIAVAGHSLGGLAALALAGGDDQTCDWPMGLDATDIPPETCVPILPDPRIKAIVPIDPTSYALHYAELARIKIPSMVMGQEWSTLESAQANVESLLARPHSAIQGRPNYRVDFAYANHSSFSNHCEYAQVMNDYGIYDDEMVNDYSQKMCQPEPVSQEELGNLTTQYMIAFLKTVLVGENGYKEMLTTDYALENEPFIEFFETEEGSPDETVEEGYFSYFKHQSDTERATALKDP